MSVDLNKLSPAPWFIGDNSTKVRSLLDAPGEEPVELPDSFTIANCWSGSSAPRPEIAAENARFIVLARAAFAGDREALAWWEANRVHPADS